MEKNQETIWLLTVRQKTPAYPWVEGTLEEMLLDRSWIGRSYGFQAKVYNDGSKFGINKGRVSKLAVWKNETGGTVSFRKTIANYDRGWDVQPTDDTAKDVLKRIIDGLEESPKSEI